MDDLLVPIGIDPDRVKFLELVANADDDVRIVKAEVDVVVAHESNRSEGVWMIVWEDALAVERGRNWKAEQIGEFEQRCGCLRPGGTMAG